MFCRIYLACEDSSKGSILLSINDLLTAKLVSNKYIEKDGYSIEIRSNDEYDVNQQKVFPGGFLYFPFGIEIDIEEGISNASAAEEVSPILEFLWKNNYPAIASCDFEDLLPKNGGYKSDSIPWVE